LFKIKLNSNEEKAPTDYMRKGSTTELSRWSWQKRFYSRLCNPKNFFIKNCLSIKILGATNPGKPHALL